MTERTKGKLKLKKISTGYGAGGAYGGASGYGKEKGEVELPKEEDKRTNKPKKKKR